MFIIISIIVMVALDQLVKYWTINVLKDMHTMPIIQDVFHLTYVENRGAAFSILENQIWFFVIITAIVLIIIAYGFKKDMIRTKLGKLGLILISGGAIGNLIDRIARGFVVDLFDFRLINFAVFNVADIFVCVGTAIFMYYMLIQHDKAEVKIESEVETDNE